MRYLALRRRADLLLAGLGADRSRTLVITGGLSDADQAPADYPKPAGPKPAAENKILSSDWPDKPAAPGGE
jgi:hypothetical protein